MPTSGPPNPRMGASRKTVAVDPRRERLENWAAMASGWPTGIKRGGLNAARGLADAAILGGRLFDPTDSFRHPSGEAAWDIVTSGVADGFYNGGRAVVHPIDTARAIANDLAALRRGVDPTASPPAPTRARERQRYRQIGVNQGELAVDAAATIAPFAPAKVIGKLDRLRPRPGPEKYVAQGFPQKAAAFLAEPYDGEGHHMIQKQDAKALRRLGIVDIPKRIMDGPYNLVRPEGMTRGDFHELHYYVDPSFRRANFPDRIGGGWTGSKLGLRKGTLPERVLFGTTTPLKARVLGAPIAFGSAVNSGTADGEP